jgi:hypothetical protein
MKEWSTRCYDDIEEAKNGLIDIAHKYF